MLISSGDDHDYCEHTHHNGIREITIKSFSSSTGIRRPGFQLLSLVPPSTTSQSSITHADRPCFLPDQVGVYNRVYFPLFILTIVYLLFTNIRLAYQRWIAAGHSFYGDFKSRLSPNMPSNEKLLIAPTLPRRTSERPVPLALPSRKSSQYLPGSILAPNTAMPRPNRLGSAFGIHDPRSSRSAPVSPQTSPGMSYSEDSFYHVQSGLSRTDDEESALDTPSISRRSSYIFMHGGPDFQTPAPLAQEPSSYFMPMQPPAGAGLGLSTPIDNYPTSGSNDMRRANSFTTSNNRSPIGLGPPPTIRRTTMPRMLSTSDWAAAAKAKEKSVLGLMVDSLAQSGASRYGEWRAWEAFRGFVRWLWKARNSVVVRSWREVVAVAWPPAVVWVVVNGLFFLG